MDNKVKITERNIFVNGVQVGRLEGGFGVYYLALKVGDKTTSVARFKYRKALANAKEFVKCVLSKATPEEVIAGCAYPNTPAGWAKEKFGYESLNMREMKARQAEHEARAEAWKNVVLIG